MSSRLLSPPFEGSFFIPMLVMVYVYLRISCVVANRHDDMVQIKVHQVSENLFPLHESPRLPLERLKGEVFMAFNERTFKK